MTGRAGFTIVIVMPVIDGLREHQQVRETLTPSLGVIPCEYIAINNI